MVPVTGLPNEAHREHAQLKANDGRHLEEIELLADKTEAVEGTLAVLRTENSYLRDKEALNTALATDKAQLEGALAALQAENSCLRDKEVQLNALNTALAADKARLHTVCPLYGVEQ